MIKRFALLMLFTMMLSACGTAQTVPPPTQNIQATVEAAAGTMVASTLTAMPTATLPPTSTPQPSPTITLITSDTPTVEGPQATSTLAVLPTSGATPTAFTGTFDPGNTTGLPEGFLHIENHTGQPLITVTLNGITLQRDQPIYYAYQVTNLLNLTVKWANYNFVVQIPGKRILTGSYRIANKDKTTMYVYLTKIVITGP